MGAIGDFFIFCSGANSKILEQCPTDKPKYQGIGATIFFTAVLATFSGGYAIHFVFENLAFSIPFGLLWGVIIFNLDRYIVLSIKKTGKFKEEALFALPRFLIALVLALTISKPLELRLFENRIAKQLGKENQAYVNEYDSSYNTNIKELNDQITALDNDLIKKKQDIFNKDPEYSKLAEAKSTLESKQTEIENQIANNNAIISRNIYYETIYRQNGSSYRVRRYKQPALNAIAENKNLNVDLGATKSSLSDNAGKITKRTTELADLVKNTEQETQKSKNIISQQLENQKANYPAEKAKKQSEAANSTDLLARLEALGNLKSFGNPVWWASAVITLLFILLETAPVTVKLLSKRGPYDEILEKIEYEIFIEQKKTISDLNDKINHLMDEIQQLNKLKGTVTINTEKAKLDAQLKANQNLLTQIANKQEQLAQIAIDKWFNDEKSKLSSDPNYNYVNNGNASQKTT